MFAIIGCIILGITNLILLKLLSLMGRRVSALECAMSRRVGTLEKRLDNVEFPTGLEEGKRLLASRWWSRMELAERDKKIDALVRYLGARFWKVEKFYPVPEEHTYEVVGEPIKDKKK